MPDAGAALTPGGVLAGVLVLLATVPWWVHRPVRRVRGRSVPERGPGRLRRLVGSPPVEPEVDLAVLLDVLDAAISAGAAVPAAIDALGRAVPRAQGVPLARVSAALRLGAGWDEAWHQAPESCEPVRRALTAAWVDGVAPGPLLRRAAETVRARRASSAREAAARLGVRLVLPLGLCLLPAFVLLGLVPVLLSTGTGLLGP